MPRRCEDTSTSCRVAGRWFFEPSGRPGPGRDGFGAPAGEPVFTRRFLGWHFCCSRRGPRRRCPSKLRADKGYDYDHLRMWLRSRRITPRIARKGVEPSTRLGRHRWTVERTVSWLGGFRRLHRRDERKAAHFLAFTSMAVAVICYRCFAE